MLPWWKSRVRLAHAAFAISAALLIFPGSRALAGTAVVRDIFIEERAPVYPDARRRALQRAMQDAVKSAMVRPASVSPQRAESMVTFIEVLDETIRPEYYAIRVSIAVTGDDIRSPEPTEGGPLPVVHIVAGGDHGLTELRPPRPSREPPGLRLGIKVPLGNAGALNAYRSLLSSLDVQHVAIHANPELLLDVTVKVRHRPAVIPTPAPDSGILIAEEPPDDQGPAP
ncbi:hypothetical protein [Azospirillum sp. sgz301742]